jgi:hypothetical protein
MRTCKERKIKVLVSSGLSRIAGEKVPVLVRQDMNSTQREEKYTFIFISNGLASTRENVLVRQDINSTQREEKYRFILISNGLASTRENADPISA